jgi:hypothetical protein
LETRTPSSRPPAGVGSMFSSMATPTGRIRKFLIPASHQSAGASRVRGSPRSGAVPARLEEFRFGTVGAVGGCSDTTDGFSNHWEEKMAIPRQARPGAAGRAPAGGGGAPPKGENGEKRNKPRGASRGGGGAQPWDSVRE